MPVWASSGEREKNKQIRVHVQLKIAQLGNQIRFPGKKIAKKGPVKNREISDMWVFKQGHSQGSWLVRLTALTEFIFIHCIYRIPIHDH